MEYWLSLKTAVNAKEVYLAVELVVTVEVETVEVEAVEVKTVGVEVDAVKVVVELKKFKSLLGSLLDL